jgi:hypothetical protein
MADMKLGHVGALAVVGWYLMAPATVRAPGCEGRDCGLPDPKSPLSTWIIVDSFQTASECKKWLEAETKAALQGRNGEDPLYACIASDDPRLKEK